MNKTGPILAKAFVFLVVMSILCGGIYTAVVTGIAQLAFPHQANGSIIEIDGKRYGSELLGQQFEDEDHMWGRVMKIDTSTFTDEQGNPVLYSWATNLTPASADYEALIAKRVEKLKAAHPSEDEKAVPVDLVTCSGSGLDPHISPAAAEYQVARIAANTGKSEEEVRAIVAKYTEGRFWGVFGEPRVNVLKVNLALDGIL
ncbi:potassium-transporting ATPase subunit KdpC [Anaerotruncus sp. AF02-27]|uniref:potassium-transporting ATPase subunit KdpC n=1 Tax=Anaerotruncus TaxID=244127 RepID=UPI000E4CE5F4|nr:MULTISPECIES: potassium-transporting ATPase subunit KdpC [Anaerotruncus]RGX55459.1 potassium-transporting ATPase subunit KdpC [Anaerotruncus sp. AF02-27]